MKQAHSFTTIFAICSMPQAPQRHHEPTSGKGRWSKHAWNAVLEDWEKLELPHRLRQVEVNRKRDLTIHFHLSHRHCLRPTKRVPPLTRAHWCRYRAAQTGWCTSTPRLGTCCADGVLYFASTKTERRAPVAEGRGRRLDETVLSYHEEQVAPSIAGYDGEYPDPQDANMDVMENLRAYRDSDGVDCRCLARAVLTCSRTVISASARGLLKQGQFNRVCIRFKLSRRELQCLGAAYRLKLLSVTRRSSTGGVLRRVVPFPSPIEGWPALEAIEFSGDPNVGGPSVDEMTPSNERMHALGGNNELRNCAIQTGRSQVGKYLLSFADLLVLREVTKILREITDLLYPADCISRGWVRTGGKELLYMQVSSLSEPRPTTVLPRKYVSPERRISEALDEYLRNNRPSVAYLLEADRRGRAKQSDSPIPVSRTRLVTGR
ncbi:hypothetical protein V8E53_011161 [Lactarius tabidus]